MHKNNENVFSNCKVLKVRFSYFCQDNIVRMLIDLMKENGISLKKKK